MEKIRVLVVDDAVVVRKLVTDVLAGDPAIEVVGTAANGRIALAKISQLKPDLITLDVEMPEMDGLSTLKELRKTNKTLPVIMFSTLCERGAAATLDALSLGANDYVTKPANVGSVAAGMERVRTDLIPKIKSLCRRHVPSTVAPQPHLQTTFLHRPPLARANNVVDVVTIGVSTGGPDALNTLIPALPADFPVPVLIVQHMPPTFTRLLSERLAARSSLPVAEAVHGQPVLPGHVYLAQGGFHLMVQRRGTSIDLLTNSAPPENSCRPSVDVLFRSVAQVYGGRTLAAVLTGMGQDGLLGCQPIRNAGGSIIVQDESSSVVWGMPGFVAKAGLADAVLPLSRIAQEIIRRVAVGRPNHFHAAIN